MLIVFILYIKKSLKPIPGKLQNIFEVIIDILYDFAHSVIGDEKKTKKVFPLFLALFIFILSANLLPYLFPGQSAITINNGSQKVPLFRSIMSDYGIVLMLSLSVVIITQIAALAAHGPLRYIGNFINLDGVIKFIKFLIKGKFRIGVLMQGLLDLFLGVMDILSEGMKVVSLSFRLFGNIFTGEILTAVILALMPYFLPLPFMFLGLLSAVIQAFVFAMLTLISIGMATEAEENGNI
jgi:F-type H+-transporting ATPase subunit a